MGHVFSDFIKFIFTFSDIVLELEKLDDMEYNVLAPPPLNDKVMKDKRRKLMETWNRVVKLYEKEDVEQHVDLKKMWHNYLKRKEEVMDHYDAVKTAQSVDIEEIPLPSLPESNDRYVWESNTYFYIFTSPFNAIL